MRQCPRLLLGLILLLAVASRGAPAEARSWTIESFDVLLEVRPDSTLRLTETIQPRFVGHYNGIFRTIPIDYEGPRGFNYRLFFSLESIRDPEGHDLRYESSRDGHYRKFKIWIPGAEDAIKTVVITYTAENALRYFPDHDELFWNVTGNEWPVPIARASAQVVLPSQAAGSLRAKAFTGPWGSTQSDADVLVQDNKVAVSARRSLDFGEGLTIVAGWEKGVVAEPTFLQRASQFFRSNWVLLVPIAVLGAMCWAWYTRGRDPALTRSIAPLYNPPEGLTAAEVGMLADNRPDLRDVTATLVDLAVRGYLFIEETEQDVLFGHKKDYLFRLRRPRGEWKDLTAHECLLLQAIFRGAASSDPGRVVLPDATLQQLSKGPMPGLLKKVFGVEMVPSSEAAQEQTSEPEPTQEEMSRLSSLENRFYTDLRGIRGAIASALIQRRYYDRDPQKVKKTWLGIGFALVVLGFIGIGPSQALGISPVSAVVALVLSGVIVMAFGWVMPARTRRGVDAWAGVRGFEEFLARVEKDRLERMATSPQTFEKFLPYAMALGVERNWARAFEGIYKEPPDWYRGDWRSGFRPSLLLTGLSSMSSHAATTFASSPRSSSGGSGFGGGGSSGGGFGGGGGGAF